MAFIYHRYYHVLEKNGENILVSEQDWGQQRLTGQDLIDFNDDFTAAFEEYRPDLEAGKIVVEDLTESITVNGLTMVVKIGEKVTFPGATSRFVPPAAYFKWHDQMKQDPNLTFKDPVWIDETP